MPLSRERITLNPYEESPALNPPQVIPLELGGDRWGHGIFIQPGGSLWPSATETPQLAQSVDTEGALVPATTIGTRQPVLKIQIVEPTDPASTNYVTNPQIIGSPQNWQQNAATGWVQAQLIRDLVGFDYAEFLQLPGTNANEGLTSASFISVPTANTPYTFGVWLKGAAGGEGVTIALGSSTNALTLTSTWQWYTVTNTNPGTTTPTLKIIATTITPINFYKAGPGLIDGTSFTEYFDGSFPGCSWTGAPSGSTSTRPASGGPRLNAIMADVERQVAMISKYRTGTLRRTLPTTSGSNTRVTYDLIGAVLNWDDTSKMNAGVAQGTLTFTAEPYARGPEMTQISDSFTVFVPANYTMDSGASADFAPQSGGFMQAASNLTTEHRFLYTGQEYPFTVGEVSAQFTPNTTIASWKGGVILKRSSPNTYLEAYVTDNGTNSILNLDKIIAGTRTNVATTTLAARIASGTNYVVRARIQRQNNSDYVFVEYFANSTDANLQSVTPTNILGSYTVTDNAFFALTPSSCGVVITPQTAGASFRSLKITPFLARERIAPVLRFGLPGVPGSAPGLGRMNIQNDSTADQFWLRWGVQHDRLSRMSSLTDLYYPASSLTLVNGSASVAGSGYAGAINANVVQNGNAQSGVMLPMLQTGYSGNQLAHIGDFEVYARVYGYTTGLQWALQWGVGDLISWSTNSTVVSPPSTATGNGSIYNAWTIIDLGAIHVPAVTTGVQQWQGNILIGGPTYQPFVIDYIFLVPLNDGAGTAKGVIAYTPPVGVVGVDGFKQATSGNLSGTTAKYGGTWTTTGGSATDFTFTTVPF